MDNALWDRLPAPTRTEVDRLLGIDHNVHAIKLIRESVGEPVPGIPACVDLIDQRHQALGRYPRADSA
ncbi:hypothetical protein [Streptomyces cucumeris]|uniref:hypothetical protein n=1 Tax=Streptomyces cucumeris TaxID=2962890 RepID=UPI003D736448